MQQVYHTNATTNIHIRSQIQNNSFLSTEELSNKFGVSTKTILKWKNRDFQIDGSSRPMRVEYALSDLQQSLVVSVRKTSWLSLDDIWEMLLIEDENVTRISVYRTLKTHFINTVPKAEKEKLKIFKEYEPGYLHVDVTYLPKINGKKYYLFVAIDRATRTLFYCIYENKTAESAQDFFDKCMDFFPFEITHILTDNGLEFTNKLLKSKKGEACKKSSLLDIKCHENNIEHRLTAPFTPKTNGMVERVNGIIKSNTIAKTDYKDYTEMNENLIKFLIYYNLERRHGALRRELNVKTPLNAIEKWYQLKPKIFKKNPNQFKNKILNLKHYLNN